MERLECVIFLFYSFLGWFLECCVQTIRDRKFVNRGVLTGPFTCLYGIYIVLCEVFLRELRDNLFFLLSGCCILFGLCEWVSGRLLQRIYSKRFWDYTKRAFHIDGYVCLYSILWGGMIGMAGMRWLNPLLYRILSKAPYLLMVIVQVILLAVILADALWTYGFLMRLPQKRPALDRIHNSMEKSSLCLREQVIVRSANRIKKAFPLMKRESVEKRTDIFAYGCSFYKLVWLFLIGAFAGDIIETVFCRISMGTWMSRSSLVIGDLSVVWGLGIAIFTLLLYNYRTRSDSYIFIMGTVLGGAFEYVCSVFTEKVFGKVFWDYSDIPFNLRGRINLLFCFFWGIAAVIWMKWGYPFLSKYIEKIPLRAGKCITWFLCVFLTADILLSMAAMVRYGERADQNKADTAVERWLDDCYPDSVMEKIYPNAKEEIGGD